MNDGRLRTLCRVLLATSLPAVAALAGEPPRLSLPFDCVPGRTCFVQNHVDLDPGSGVRDYACGEATYDGHKGVDVRLLSSAATAEGVAVRAAAPGTVKGVRDGMEDRLLRDGSRKELSGRECGNGVVLDHGGGWETQYCHLRRGSIAVRRGDSVGAGGHLGSVGYSGLSDFAHLHFEVRRDGQILDPFTGLAPGASCLTDGGGAPPPGGLWDDSAARAFPRPGPLFIETGFEAAVPGTGELERGGAARRPAGPAGSGLVFFARLMHGRPGDTIRLAASGPGGFTVSETVTVGNGRAVFVAAVGRRLTQVRWPAGRYEGTAELERKGEVVARSRAEFLMP